jgi:hypothetical protein
MKKVFIGDEGALNRELGEDLGTAVGDDDLFPIRSVSNRSGLAALPRPALCHADT